jgi:hypothetical protein
MQDAEAQVEEGGQQSRRRAGGDGDRRGGVGIDAMDDQRRRDRCTQWEAAIDGEIGEVQDADS